MKQVFVASGSEVKIRFSTLDADRKHAACTINTTTTRLSSHPSVAPTVSGESSGNVTLTFSSLSPALAEGDDVTLPVNGNIGSDPAWTEHELHVVVRDAERGTNNASTYDGSDTAGTTTLLSRLTGTRANNLDNLDVAISVIQSQIANINNLTSLANWMGSLLLEKPEAAGQNKYIFELVIKDSNGELVNLDAPPTITLVNANGDDRSSLITSSPLLGPRPSTGRYQIEMTIAVGTTTEPLTLRATGQYSGNDRYAMLGLQVVDYDTSSQINEILSKIGTPVVTLADDIANLPAIDDFEGKLIRYTAAVVRSDNAVAADLAAEISQLNQDFGSGAGGYSPVGSSQQYIATRSDQIHTNQSTMDGKLDALVGVQADLVEDNAGTFRFTAAALAQAPSGGGGGGLQFEDIVPDPGTNETVGRAFRKMLEVQDTIGPGATLRTIEIQASGTPVPGADVWVSTDAAGGNVIAGTRQTDAFGKVQFRLDPGTYYVWAQKAGVDFTNPTTLVVP